MKVIPCIPTKGWAIIDTNGHWCYPTYVRMTLEASWKAFQESHGQGSVSVGELMEMGYRQIEVLIAPIEQPHHK